MRLAHRALGMARKRANDLMTETVQAGRVVDGTDPVTGDATQTIAEPFVYEGPARVKYPGTAVSDSTATGQLVASQTVMVKLPVGSPVVPEGSVFLVTGSTVDGSLVGRLYRVDGAPEAGQVSAHRYPVTELS